MYNSELISQSKQDRRTAFSMLYEAVYADLYRFAYYYFGNIQDAEDAVQETAMDAYLNIHKLKNESAFKSWIFTILSVKCKRIMRHFCESKKNLSLDNLDSIKRPDALNSEMLDAILVWQSILTLSETDKAIVLLSVIGGYSGREISGIVKMPESTVRSRLFRALNKLRNNIKE